MKGLTLFIPNGYSLKECRELLDIQEAEKRLRSKKIRRRYAYAERLEDEQFAILKGYTLVCPYCGKETTAYSETEECSISKGQIEAWANRQLTIFEEPPKRLVIHQDLHLPKQMKCEKCFRESTEKHDERLLIIRYHRKKLSVECQSNNAALINLLFTRCRRSLTLTFPFAERFTMNLRNGHSYYSVIDGTGKVIIVADITRCPDHAPNSTVMTLLQTYPVLKRKLVRAFEKAVERKCPFAMHELTPERLVFMNLFQGFSKPFYDAVPLTDDLILGREFSRITKQLHCASDTELLFRRLKLPQVKSVRRRMFEQPGLFLYAEELEKIWAMFYASAPNDYDRFCRLLAMPQLFHTLALMKQYPAACIFLADYCQEQGGGKAFLKLINDRRKEDIFSYAILYAAMAGNWRRREQTKWQGRGNLNAASRQALCIRYSVPELENSQVYQDFRVRGFVFSWLRSSAEYVRAGNALDNCLRDWRPSKGHAVLVMKRNERPVAAIETYGNAVLQAYGAHNTPIDVDIEISHAFDDWARKYHYSWYRTDRAIPGGGE